MKQVLLLALTAAILVACDGGPTTPTPPPSRPKILKPHQGDVFFTRDRIKIKILQGGKNLAVQAERISGGSYKKYALGCSGFKPIEWYPRTFDVGVWRLNLLDHVFACGGYHTSTVYDQVVIYIAKENR